ncbi:hypothetical protein HMPREF3190_00272 [Umbribacter vaginalis]|nr:hypothetical protein HMPREF3190_00272 [Coriobacteriales bacterium DNF00809]
MKTIVNTVYSFLVRVSCCIVVGNFWSVSVLLYPWSRLMSQACVCGMRVLHHALNALINVISTRVR